MLEELRQERAAVDRHQGRVRAFPHKEGNYATHVYIARAHLLMRVLHEHHTCRPVPASCRTCLHL